MAWKTREDHRTTRPQSCRPGTGAPAQLRRGSQGIPFGSGTASRVRYERRLYDLWYWHSQLRSPDTRLPLDELVGKCLADQFLDCLETTHEELVRRICTEEPSREQQGACKQIKLALAGSHRGRITGKRCPNIVEVDDGQGWREGGAECALDILPANIDWSISCRSMKGASFRYVATIVAITRVELPAPHRTTLRAGPRSPTRPPSSTWQASPQCSTQYSPLAA